MSVQRSPPSALAQLNPPNSTTHYNSDSAINNMANTSEPVDNYFNITKRQKRTFDDLGNNPGCSSELKQILE